MKKIKFYSCPDCGNVLCSTGESEISCCGRKLYPLPPQPKNPQHEICVEEIENDYFITLQHEMTKQHFITFVAYVTYDRVLLVKLYPEQPAEVRFPRMSRGKLYLCCNTHGLIEFPLPF